MPSQQYSSSDGYEVVMSRRKRKQLKTSAPSSNKSRLYIKETRYEPWKSTTDSIEKTKRKSALEEKRRQEENKVHSKRLDVLLKATVFIVNMFQLMTIAFLKL